MCQMLCNILTVSAANVKCERVFNIAKTMYDHRKTYDSIIFFRIDNNAISRFKKIRNEIKCRFVDKK